MMALNASNSGYGKLVVANNLGMPVEVGLGNDEPAEVRVVHEEVVQQERVLVDGAVAQGCHQPVRR